VGVSGVITLQEALSLILAQARPLPVMSQPLSQIGGYVLAQPVMALMDIPRFTNSACDGFAVRLADVATASPEAPVCLRLQTTVHAGQDNTACLSSGCTVKVLTGAAVPCGAEAVVMQEQCVESDGTVLVKARPAPGESIRMVGEEFRQGDELIPGGVRATPPIVGMLATLGYQAFPVHRRPKVSLVVTGNELATPGDRLGPGRIYDANTSALGAALVAHGVADYSAFQARDELSALQAVLNQALAGFDLVLTVGGVSVGESDLVREALGACGALERFWRVAIKPGKPLYFATRQVDGSTQLVFGLPGNPVSALVVYHQLVVPALRRMMGERDVRPLPLRAVLAADLRKVDARLEFVRAAVKMQDGRLVVHPTPRQGSHMLSGLAPANGLIHFPAHMGHLASGTVVDVDMLMWGCGGPCDSSPAT
jgi:molybdopterin molybdotransferase